MIPASSPVFDDLDRLFPLLYDGLDAGAMKARAYFTDRDVEVDAELFPDILRYQAKLRFEQLAHGHEFHLRVLQRNGLSISYGPYCLRVRKSDNGSLPPAGPSKSLQRFYSQNHDGGLQLPLLTPPGGTERIANVNLVLLWEVSSMHTLKRLRLACPVYGDEQTARAAWVEEIPRLLEQSQASDSDTDQVPDLAFTRLPTDHALVDSGFSETTQIFGDETDLPISRIDTNCADNRRSDSEAGDA